MSKYTTEVRYICEQAAGLDESVGADSVDRVISQSWLKVVGTNWPCWAVVEPGGGAHTYHEVLAKKILKHYYTREIGFETVGLWKLKLNTKLNEIMPYYVNLYKTVEKEYDWLRDADYYRQHEGSNAGENSENKLRRGNYSEEGEESSEYESDRTASGTHWNTFSDTPQGSLTNVANETYLTNATKDTDSTTGHEEGTGSRTNEKSGNRTDSEDNSGEFSNTEEYLDHVYGKMPGKSITSLLMEYRDSIINIDMMVIEELSDLFMKIW